MRKMGFENMRSGNSRYQNLVLALIIVCFYLIYTWWYLSSQNYELLKQMDIMGEQLRVCSDERVSCINRKNSADSRVADMKLTESKSLDTIKRLRIDVAELTKLNEKAKQEVQYCQTKLESLEKLDKSKSTILETMRIEKETISAQLAEAKDKVSQLEMALKNTKVTPAANIPKSVSDVIPKQVTVSPAAKPKVNDEQDNVLLEQQDGQNLINDPVQDGNHGIDNPVDQFDNAAIEDMDGQDVLKKP